MADNFYESFARIVKGGYVRLYNNRETVNNLNVFPVPDGDTGTNMSLTMQHAVEEMNVIKAKNLAESASACSAGALMGARGNSGVILSQLIRGFSKALVGKENLRPVNLTIALRGATDMAYKAVMKPTEGTILTVIREMTEFAEANYTMFSDSFKLTEEMLKAGRHSLDNTPNLLPVLKEAGVVDAGGKGLLYIIEGMLLAAQGVEEELGASPEKEEKNDEFGIEDNADIKYIYCTELLIRAKDESGYEKMLIDKLVKLGDSLLVIEDGGVIKIHVHTNEPWSVMKTASSCGEFEKIKVENMRKQHSEVFSEEETVKEKAPEATAYSKEHEQYVLVAVSPGDGLSGILKDLGVSYIISGGQTMNPSTKDFLDIIENTDGENYILLPNNSNIIMAAKQAKEMSEKKVGVLETKNIPQAVAALMCFDAAGELEENIAAMKASCEHVSTGSVTFAVRDTVAGNKQIHTGDIIAVNEKDIVSVGSDISKVAEELADNLANAETELITLYYGSEVNKKDAEALCGAIKAKYPESDVEVFFGGQPLYYYIISAE